jgi:hypothetical protein
MSGSVTWSFTTAGTSSVSIWSSSAKPTNPSEDDPNAVELGVKFTSTESGNITGVRFYKGSSNTGTHVADFWTSSGTLLATATFTNESSSGWQQVNFATPVAITAGKTYIASYHTNVGFYADDQQYFSKAYTSGPFTVPANGGVYAYGGAKSFPTQSWNASNYWVDVVLSPNTQTATVATSGSGPRVAASATTPSNVLQIGASVLPPSNESFSNAQAVFGSAQSQSSSSAGASASQSTSRGAAVSQLTANAASVRLPESLLTAIAQHILHPERKRPALVAQHLGD